MDIFLPSLLIVVVTGLMLFAMYLRVRGRERFYQKVRARCAVSSYTSAKSSKTRRLEVHFVHDEQSWQIVLYKAHYGPLLYTFVKAYPCDMLYFRPQIAYTVNKNGRRKISIPNFWAYAAGFSFCKMGKTDSLTMEVEIVFKDLLMARAFVQKLLEMGLETWDVRTCHNKIIVKWNFAGAVL